MLIKNFLNKRELPKHIIQISDRRLKWQCKCYKENTTLASENNKVKNEMVDSSYPNFNLGTLDCYTINYTIFIIEITPQ